MRETSKEGRGRVVQMVVVCCCAKLPVAKPPAVGKAVDTSVAEGEKEDVLA